jgi:hypothetical protein
MESRAFLIIIHPLRTHSLKENWSSSLVVSFPMSTTP